MKRCAACGAFMHRIGTDEDNYTCCNARCDESWQVAKYQFDTSLLGAACRMLGVGTPAREDEEGSRG